MKILSILLNPFGSLIWWLARSIGGGFDRLLGPLAGWLLAWLLVLASVASLAGAAYGLREPIAKLSGYQQRDIVTEISGRVIAAETETRKTMSVTQTVSAEYIDGDVIRQITGTLTAPSTDEKNVGDVVTIYMTQDGKAGLRNPEDPYLETFFAVFALGFPALGLFFSLRYLRYRQRIRNETKTRPDGVLAQDRGNGPSLDGLVVRGRKSVKSREERLREEAEKIRQMHDKAAHRKNS